jgi:hypothetical protein
MSESLSPASTEDGRTSYTPGSASLVGPQADDVRPCVCAFDFDATLTSAAGCPGAVRCKARPEYWLSPAAQDLPRTECGRCFTAILSAGGERPAKEMVTLPRSQEVEPKIMWNLPPHRKGDALDAVVTHFRDRGVLVERRDVHFFDDNPGVVASYASRNPDAPANQVSCPSAADPRGKCGALVADIVLRSPGVRSCSSGNGSTVFDKA